TSKAIVLTPGTKKLVAPVIENEVNGRNFAELRPVEWPLTRMSIPPLSVAHFPVSTTEAGSKPVRSKLVWKVKVPGLALALAADESHLEWAPMGAQVPGRLASLTTKGTNEPVCVPELSEYE